MPYMQLKYKPGIFKEGTRYAAAGTWFESSLVRFRDGFPEVWSGWQIANDNLVLDGICRSLFRFTDLQGLEWVGIPTNRRVYVLSDDIYYDITPLASSSTLGNDPLDTETGSNIITITDTATAHFPGEIIIITGAVDTNGIPAGEINGEHLITAYVSDDEYQITVTTAASSTGAGGGSAIEVDYLFSAGSEDQITGGGWGSLAWGEEEWGGEPALGAAEKMGMWSQWNWGEDLVLNANKGPIFYWDRSNESQRAVNIRDLGGADGNAPETADFIVVSHRDRHLLAFGATQFGTSVVAPMSFRWCSQEDITNWDEASLTGTAGSLPLSHGSYFIAAEVRSNEILAWTNTTLYSIQYIGSPYIYSADVISSNVDIAGLNCAKTYNSVTYWMGRSGFYAYGGQVERLSCTVQDYILTRVNWEQAQKIYCDTNRQNDEVIWFYPSLDGIENDSYVSYNVVTGIWSIGSLSRTAWLDMDALNYPLATATDNRLYLHEIGTQDGSTNGPLQAFIESAPIELSSEGSYDKGDRFAFVRSMVHDVTFRNISDGVNTPTVNITLKMMNYPGTGFTSDSSSQVVKSVTMTVEEFTKKTDLRLRGRAVVLRIDNTTAGSQWRIGVPRLDIRTDGQK